MKKINWKEIWYQNAKWWQENQGASWEAQQKNIQYLVDLQLGDTLLDQYIKEVSIESKSNTEEEREK